MIEANKEAISAQPSWRAGVYIADARQDAVLAARHRRHNAQVDSTGKATSDDDLYEIRATAMPCRPNFKSRVSTSGP